MHAAVYLTIWVALALFAAGETGRRSANVPPAWAWRASAIGLALGVLHVLLAYDVVHGWSQASAMDVVARRTFAIYGVSSGGGVYMNYAFLGVWAVDLWTWRPSAARLSSRPGVITWIARAFYFILILNASVIYVPGIRRVLGMLLIACLILAWRPRWMEGPTLRSARNRPV